MRVRLLGPVDVITDGAVRTVSGLRRKAILATLALHAGEIVSTGRLAHIVWGNGAPPTGLNTLQSHVSHLRTVLGSKTAIIAKPPGYVLDLGDEGTDVALAERLLRQASLLADPACAAAELRAALALWRGEPLAELPASPGSSSRRSGSTCCAGRSSGPWCRPGWHQASTRS